MFVVMNISCHGSDIKVKLYHIASSFSTCNEGFNSVTHERYELPTSCTVEIFDETNRAFAVKWLCAQAVCIINFVHCAKFLCGV